MLFINMKSFEGRNFINKFSPPETGGKTYTCIGYGQNENGPFIVGSLTENNSNPADITTYGKTDLVTIHLDNVTFLKP